MDDFEIVVNIILKRCCRPHETHGLLLPECVNVLCIFSVTLQTGRMKPAVAGATTCGPQTFMFILQI
jgi:hypothetical protein